MKKIILILSVAVSVAWLLSACSSNSEKQTENNDTLAKEEIKVPTKIKFPSTDKIDISANLFYSPENTKGFIVYCHMADFNKSEYRFIAKKLFEEGYNGLAIDQRSGGTTSGYENETKIVAEKRGRETGFMDAEQDIRAAVQYINKEYKTKVILWGSSYSASLVLKVSKDNPRVKAVMAFSPGEYFASDSVIIKNYIQDLDKPVFITSSKDEVTDGLMNIIDAIGPDNVTHFKPTGKGEHGSMALWNDSPDNMEYWKATMGFLKKL